MMKIDGIIFGSTYRQCHNMATCDWDWEQVGACTYQDPKTEKMYSISCGPKALIGLRREVDIAVADLYDKDASVQQVLSRLNAYGNRVWFPGQKGRASA